MGIIETLAEQRIREAIERGDLEHLPGEGQPLQLEDDDPYVPAELRMAYKVMKNAGMLPPEVEARREIHSLQQLIEQNDDEQAARANRRLHYLMMKLESGTTASLLAVEAEYQQRLKKRFQAD